MQLNKLVDFKCITLYILFLSNLFYNRIGFKRFKFRLKCPVNHQIILIRI